MLDASAVVDWLLRTPVGQRIEKRIYLRGESLHAPHLLDLEVVQVFRRLSRERTISSDRAQESIQDFKHIRIARYPHSLLLTRIWELRNNLSAYDAAYVALAEKLGAVVITRDSGLASAGGREASVELF